MIIKKVKKEYTEQVNTVTYMLLKRFDKRINPNKIKGYICETRRGKAFCEEKTFTIPLWAYLCGKDYFMRGLKHGFNVMHRKATLSHPVRVRGLKQQTALKFNAPLKSHPVRVRGLKQL